MRSSNIEGIRSDAHAVQFTGRTSMSIKLLQRKRYSVGAISAIEHRIMVASRFPRLNNRTQLPKDVAGKDFERLGCVWDGFLSVSWPGKSINEVRVAISNFDKKAAPVPTMLLTLVLSQLATASIPALILHVLSHLLHIA